MRSQDQPSARASAIASRRAFCATRRASAAAVSRSSTDAVMLALCHRSWHESRRDGYAQSVSFNRDGDAQGPEVEAHRHREVAESFGSDPERYDRARPRYPTSVVERVVSSAPGRVVLDVGCGTGVASLQFQEAGCRVLGVDIDPRMADVAHRRGLAVEVAKFEDWEPAGRTFDAVVSGQSWHWIDPVAGAAKAAQALRVDGLLAVIWNVFQPPEALASEFAEVFARVLPERPPFDWADTLKPYLTMCSTAATGMRSVGPYAEPETWRVDWDQQYTREEWLDQVPTFGGHSQLPPTKRDELLAGLGDAINGVGGSFTMHYTTIVVAAVKTAMKSRCG